MIGRLAVVLACVLAATSGVSVPVDASAAETARLSSAQPVLGAAGSLVSAAASATLTPTASAVRGPLVATGSLVPSATAVPPATSVPSATAVPTPSATPTPVATVAPTSTPTLGASPTSVKTVAPTPVTFIFFTATPSPTPTRTATPMPTSTATPSPTPTLKPTFTATATSTPTAVPPSIAGIAISSITRSSATITWTTSLPASSQVDYGIFAVDASRSVLDPSLVTAHRVVLTGLLPGATYRFRVRSQGADRGLAVSPESVLVTAPAGSGPEIANLALRRVTGSTATLGWATSTGSVAQVEYGTTANYGLFTLLKVFTSPTQEMTLTGLRPATLYHYRVKGWDGDGSLAASADATFTTAPAGLATLIGDQTLQPERVTLASGEAAAYQYVAASSGQASMVRLFVDGGSSATLIRVALYSDQDGTPATILSQGSASPGTVPGWTAVSIPPIPLLESTRYWVAVLNPIGSGALNLRQASSGGSSLSSAQTGLAAFSQAWSVGAAAARSPLSVSVEQVPPAITLTGPSDGTIVTGTVQLSAVVDDDAPLSRVQFLVDGVPVDPAPVAAPYTTVWDSGRVNPAVPHTISARATDALGRSATSGVVSVQVDNGPIISGVVARQGLTASSARISWMTDMLADAQVEFGPTLAYGSMTPVDPRPEWRHDMQLTGLLPGTLYHYRVRSRDANGAQALSSDQLFFTPD